MRPNEVGASKPGLISVFWIDGRLIEETMPRGLMIRSSDELAGLLPKWPVNYMMQVVRNEATAINVSLFDYYGHALQLNLFTADDPRFEGHIILGDSTRIPADATEYGSKPSALSRQ